jgi:hypothetical protein
MTVVTMACHIFMRARLALDRLGILSTSFLPECHMDAQARFGGNALPIADYSRSAPRRYALTRRRVARDTS